MKMTPEQMARLGFRSAPTPPRARPVEPPAGDVDQLRARVQELEQALQLEHAKRMRLAEILRPILERARAEKQGAGQGRAYRSDGGALERPPTTPKAEIIRFQKPRDLPTPAVEVLPPEDLGGDGKGPGKFDPLRDTIADEADADIEDLLDN